MVSFSPDASDEYKGAMLKHFSDREQKFEDYLALVNTGSVPHREAYKRIFGVDDPALEPGTPEHEEALKRWMGIFGDDD